MARSAALLLLLALLAPWSSPAAAEASKGPDQNAEGGVVLPPMVRTVLDNGLTVIVAERHSVPTVAVTVMVRAGAAQNPPDRPGAADVLAEMLTLGTTTRSADRIAEDVDALGATLSASSGYDSTNVTLTGLSADTASLLELAADLVRNPALPAPELVELKTRRAGALKRQMDSPATLADRALQKLLFGAHPYARPSDGTVKSLEALSREDLSAFYDAAYAPSNVVLAVVGDVKPQTTMPDVKKRFGTWENRRVATSAAPEPAPLKGTRVLIIDKPDLTQGQIRIGRLGVARNTPDWYALQVSNYLLGGGGFSSRLVKRIRSERGLTYGVFSQFTPRRMTGPFSISTFTPNKSVEETIDEALAVMRRFRSEGPEERELADAKSFFIGGFPLQLETPAQVAQQLLNIELFGLPSDYLQTFPARIAAVTAADVKRVSEKQLDTSAMVIVVAMNAKDVKEALAKYGAVEIVPFTELE